MRIVTWNVNSLRARADSFATFLALRRPDVLLLQEIKCTAETFPYDLIDKTGYHYNFVGQKSYNGVAILSKIPMELVATSVLADDDQARYIEARIDGVHYISVYVPNGNPVATKLSYKLSFLDALYRRLSNLLADGVPFILGGDFNIIPNLELDCYDPAVFSQDALAMPDVVAYYQRFLDLGLVETFSRPTTEATTKNPFTWWDYRRGFDDDAGARIDFIFLCPQHAKIPYSFSIDTETRSHAKPSDHAPVLVNQFSL